MVGSNSEAVCCFCGATLNTRDATLLDVHAPDSDGVQTLFCHGACLVERLDRSVPYDPDLLGQ